MPSRSGELDTLARRTRHVLVDFDGPVCEVFAGMPSHAVADKLRRELRTVGIDIPSGAAMSDDPLEVFRAVAYLGYKAATIAQTLLTTLELRAVETARPAPGSADLIITAARTERTVTIVTNNSVTPVAAYLTRQHLDPYVGKIIGRDGPDPALMKPSPYRVRIAVGSLQAEPETCMFICDTATDVLAGRLGGVAVIGYANKTGKAQTLSDAGARAVVTDLADITTALRITRSTALPG